jgi:nucleotide-binding universal stress UspA family protein
LRAIAASFGAATEVVVRRAAPAAAILECAAQERADLVALCTHGRGGLQRLVHGSVTDKVLHLTRLPLLIVRAQPVPPPSADAFRRLLVSLDRSALAEAALPPAVAIAKSFDAELLLFHVWDESGYTFDPSHDPQVERIMRDTYAYSEQYLNDMAQRLAAQGARVRWVAESGNPADHILKAADSQSADLLIMSTHGSSGVVRSALGSVADSVLRRARKPLLVVRPPA